MGLFIPNEFVQQAQFLNWQLHWDLDKALQNQIKSPQIAPNSNANNAILDDCQHLKFSSTKPITVDSV